VRVTPHSVEVPGLSIPIPVSPGAPNPPDAPAPAKHGGALTNQNVIDMVEAHVPDEVIVSHIQTSKTKFDLSTHALIDLTKADVPAAVIDAMQKSAAGVPAAADQEATRTVAVTGGVPFQITLMEDVAENPADGLELHFHAAKDYEVDGAVVIAKGATVTGEVLPAGKKNILGRGGKPMFRLMTVEATDGSKLKVKATAGRGADKNERNLEPPGHRGKESLAPKGSSYLAYFDGDQTVAVKK
jgi:hypothetical protein